VNEEEEKRLRDVEEFIAQVRGGRKVFLWLCSGIGVVLGLLAAFWGHLFGSQS
jgi:hypothetical protein